MTLIYMQGFDVFANTIPGDEWVASNGTPTFATGRHGGRALTTGWAANWSYRRPLGANHPALIAGAGVRLPSGIPNDAQYEPIRFMDGTTTQMAVRLVAVDGARALAVIRGTTVLAVTPGLPTMTASAWIHLEFKVSFHATDGAYELRLNGVTVLAASGIQTRQTTNSYAGAFAFSTHNVHGGHLQLDDLYICTPEGPAPHNDFLGDCVIETLRPNGDLSVEWTPSTGSSNFAMLNEEQLNTTNYVETAADDREDRYSLVDLSMTPHRIHGVSLMFNYTKAEAGPRTIEGFIETGGVPFSSPPVAPSVGVHIWRHDLWPINPQTTGAWTLAQINGLVAGVRTPP